MFCWLAHGYKARLLHILRNTCIINVSRKQHVFSLRWGKQAAPYSRNDHAPQGFSGSTTFSLGEHFSDALGKFPSNSLTICDDLSLSVEDINYIFKYRRSLHQRPNLCRKRPQWELCVFLRSWGVWERWPSQLDGLETRLSREWPRFQFSAWLRLGIFFTITLPKKCAIWRTSAKYLNGTGGLG